MGNMREDFERKMVISSDADKSVAVVALLRQFLAVQQTRAEAYARLRSGFAEYMASAGGELAYQQLCTRITQDFNDCSKQVIQIESLLSTPDYSRNDLAQLLRSIQIQEKDKLNLTATIQVLKKAGRPSERIVSHNSCQLKGPTEHRCAHVQEITIEQGTEEAEVDAEYDDALKDAIRGVQNAITTINEHLDEIRYEIASIEEK
uniref:Uncharacterized protein n=2 Tax=Kalanchoe fedtschenkoi TaxID=63787 RepID=A0A7N0ZRS9_KALFE